MKRGPSAFQGVIETIMLFGAGGGGEGAPRIKDLGPECGVGWGGRRRELGGGG